MGPGNGEEGKREERWKEVGMEEINGKENRMKGKAGILFWIF